MEYQPMTNAKSSEIKLWRDLCFFLSRFLAAGTSAMDATAHGAEALNDGAKALKIHRRAAGTSPSPGAGTSHASPPAAAAGRRTSSRRRAASAPQMLWRSGAGRQEAWEAPMPRSEPRRLVPCQDFMSKAWSRRERRSSICWAGMARSPPVGRRRVSPRAVLAWPAQRLPLRRAAPLRSGFVYSMRCPVQSIERRSRR